jgi:hypothetical protein
VISSDTGVDGFIRGLRHCGLDPVVDAGVVTFLVEPLGGGLVGRAVETGVGVDELTAWPAVPPHWVHFPADVELARSNTQFSTKPGWIKHSRELRSWNNADEPAQAWIAHVRGVLEAAR